jgi:signal transduction histidine kinase
MNILSRVAQGVNITVGFDDILELVYAQTDQILGATEHFRITLYDDLLDTFHHAFYLESDERLSEQENKPLRPGVGLEQDVVRSQRSIVTDDYDNESRQRNVVPAEKSLYAWMGTPLNTGSRTIGAISVGSRNPAIVYTPEQLGLLQSIADQAAGAIVKTQLIEESEKRAHQLEMLNQVARGLTSTLELDTLLNRILESAVEILTCEAGSLFLVDEQTEELVFEVTVGPAADNLVGMRLAPGTGIVGKAVDERIPIIDNNVQQSKDWFDETDQSTGFVTRALLVVPMQVRDQVIGVIEVINKLDRSPFSADDERLLTAFTAQAGIAIQNARLFTMTDQALAARVDELSVMQRIDRELNTSLDLDRALHITLDWAMRQSEADAGLIASVEENNNLSVNASQGYKVDFGEFENLAQLEEIPSIQQILQSEHTLESSALVTSDGDAQYIYGGARSQVSIPILREQKPIGILLLESRAEQHFPPEMVSFLERLNDHAAIAISNAQFYAAVQTANLAKSEFVKFVAHELKNPMTSIRGYTELLMKGAVGEVNEAQEGFLSTVHSNVNRMTTLVSDLTDASKMEVGQLRLDFSAVGVLDVVQDVVRSTQQQIDQKEQQLELNVPDDIPSVWGDRTRLIQIITNLVSNAYKYTPEKGNIFIDAHVTSETDEKTKATVDFVQISVRDTGIGISEEDQKKIFTQFFRSDDNKAREAPGTGLGLNITKNLVEMQGGKIWFESVFREGTTFSITVPVAEAVAVSE